MVWGANEGRFLGQKSLSLNKSFAGVQGAVFQKRPLAAGGKLVVSGILFGI